MARLVRRTVRERFGHELRPEVRFIRRLSERQLLEDWAPPANAGEKLNRVLLPICLYMYQILSFLAGAALLFEAVLCWQIDPQFSIFVLVFAVLLLTGFVINLCRKW